MAGGRPPAMIVSSIIFGRAFLPYSDVALTPRPAKSSKKISMHSRRAGFGAVALPIGAE
jgi:hypothetical protein